MKIVLFLLPLMLWSVEDFISDYEYGEMLYKNPRGVSCATCHGMRGEGQDIVSYQEDGKTVTVRGSDIRKTTLSQLKSTVDRNHPIMPKYYLTLGEVNAIYNYLRLVNQEKSELQKSEQ